MKSTLKVPARISGPQDKKILVAIYPYPKFREEFNGAVHFSLKSWLQLEFFLPVFPKDSHRRLKNEAKKS